MMDLVLVLGGYGVVSGLYVFCVNKSHLLKSLLSLEFISLMIYWLLNSVFVGLICEQFFSLFYLVLVVGEGVLGLSLLVLMCYGYGGDAVKMVSLVVC